MFVLLVVVYDFNACMTNGSNKRMQDWTDDTYGQKVEYNPLTANPTKWSNTLKQFVGCCCGVGP